MDVHVVPLINSGNIISVLRSVFAYLRQWVSDNGTAFTSAEFRIFLKRSGIKQITSAPYHSATNSLAEHTIQTFKNALGK